MEMYRDSYVVAVLVNGKVQKETSDGLVLIPFGSEYVLRLKNKLRKRSVADVWLDGRIACRGVILNANGTLDLERFVDTDLSSGKKFKLVRTTDSRVEQPEDSENGILEVNFYQEKEAPLVEKVVHHEYRHPHVCYGHCSLCCSCSICRPQYYGGVWATMPLGSSVVYTSTTTSAASASCNSSLTSLRSDAAFTSCSEPAATVEGSTSLQKFSRISIDVDHSKAVTIRLKLRGLTVIKDVCQCGYRRKTENYCPTCGLQLAS